MSLRICASKFGLPTYDCLAQRKFPESTLSAGVDTTPFASAIRIRVRPVPSNIRSSGMDHQQPICSSPLKARTWLPVQTTGEIRYAKDILPSFSRGPAHQLLSGLNAVYTPLKVLEAYISPAHGLVSAPEFDYLSLRYKLAADGDEIDPRAPPY